MKNFKRILALVIATIMVVGTFATVSAGGATAWYQAAVNWFENQGIAVIGTKAGQKITRSEFVFWVAKIETAQLSDNAWNERLAGYTFSDVDATNPDHHAAAIEYSQEMGYIIGNGDGTFAPDKVVSLAEASAVIVRLLDFDKKVADKSEKNWAMNYMTTANLYCHSFDSTFLANTDTYNPNYELTYGEAAYLLACVLNCPVVDNFGNGITVLTADGINLGERIANAVGGSIGKAYYVTSMKREVYTANINPVADYGVNYDFSPMWLKDVALNRTNGCFDVTSSITLVSTDGTEQLTVPGADVMKYLGLTSYLGVSATTDANKKVIYNDKLAVFDKINVGTVVNIVKDKATGKVTSMTPSKGSVVVDTILQAKAYNDSIGNYPFFGWANANRATTDYKPVLPTSYTADNVVSWTNVVRDGAGKVTSATMNFQGKEYKLPGADIEFVWGSDTTVAMDLDTAVKAVINAAQGEAFIVFNDLDLDGSYDTVIVEESHPFVYAQNPNVPSNTTTLINFYSSLSTLDDVVKGKFAIEGKSPKGQPFGSVVLNKTVTYTNQSSANVNTDAFALSNTATGKLQLVLCASNAHFASAYGKYDVYTNVLPYYTVVDLAAFGVGLIEKVDAYQLNGYWVATVRKTDNSYETVYIPQVPATAAEFDVTIGGATETYAFDASQWLTFLTDDVKNGCLEAGIINENTVAALADEEVKANIGAWMVGHYVEYAIDSANKAVVMNSTDAKTGTTGFVAGIEKLSDGDNAYNVTVAKSATGTGSMLVETKYLEAAFDGGLGEYRITTPYAMDGSGKANNKVPTVGKIRLTNTVGMYNFAGGNENNENYNYGYNGNAYMLVACPKSNTAAGRMHLNTTVGLLNEAINFSVYSILPNTNTATLKIENKQNLNEWTVDAEGIVHDQTGAKVAFQHILNASIGVGGVATYKVRANASSMFDWANYNVYNALFQKKALIDPNAGLNGRVDAGKDLIYVSVYKDAGAYNYIVYGDPTDWSGTKHTAGEKYQPHKGGGAQFYAQNIINGVAPADNWHAIDGEYDLGCTMIAGTKTPVYDAYGVECGYTAKYNRKIGVGPYYDRTKTSDGYTYVLRFTTVTEYTNVQGAVNYAIDPATTTMFALLESNSLKQVVDDGSYAARNIPGEAPRYYIDSDKFVYSIHEAGYNTKKTVEVYSYEGATVEATTSDVAFAANDVKTYATVTAAAAPMTTPGWYPGVSTVTIDGVDYTALASTPVVLATPSKNGFDITVMTVGDIPAEGLFITDWNSAVAEGNNLTAIALIGEKATVGGTVVGPTTPGAPSFAKVDLDKGQKLVYLAADAKALVVSGLYATTWNVESDRSAYTIDGEEVGTIYRAYSTYEAANKAATIDLSVEGGKWYVVNANGAIVKEVSASFGEGVVTAVKNGKTYGTIGGKKDVDFSAFNFAFIYKSADGAAIMKAGNSTSVSIVSKSAYESAYAAKKTAYDTAKTAYDTAFSGVATPEKLAELKEAMDTAYAALIATKEAYIEAHFNGQFWNVPNSPYEQYVVLGRNFQQEVSTVNFNYVKVGDTIYVLADEFSF